MDVTIKGTYAGWDTTNNVLHTSLACTPKNITTATTTLVKTGAGVFNTLVINKAVVTGVITIYDGVDAGGVLMGTVTFGAALLSDPPRSVEYGLTFATGLCIVTSAAFDLTVGYV